jgi:hypothetical protein
LKNISFFISALQSMQPGEVIVAKWQSPLRYQYFRNLLPDMSVTKCETCNKMFHTDDYELQLLQKGHCPFCRAPAPFASNTGSNPAVIGGSGIGGVNGTSEMSNNFSLS